MIVRPHSRSFVYDADDLRVIERDVRAAVAAGANGVVFGALDPRGDVDLGALAGSRPPRTGARSRFTARSTSRAI